VLVSLFLELSLSEMLGKSRSVFSFVKLLRSASILVAATVPACDVLFFCFLTQMVSLAMAVVGVVAVAVEKVPVPPPLLPPLLPPLQLFLPLPLPLPLPPALLPPLSLCLPQQACWTAKSSIYMYDTVVPEKRRYMKH